MNRLAWGEPRPEGPRRGRWTQDEIAHLQDWYGLRDLETLARELARKPESVQKQAEIVCRHAPRHGPWSDEEISVLKKYLGLATEEIIGCVLGREISEVRTQLAELGNRRREGAWSRDERSRLKQLYGSRSDEDLATILERPVESVKVVARELRLAKDKVFLKRHEPRQITRMPRWTGAALEELRERYPRESNIDIARSLGRSVKSVVSKAHQLGLKKQVERLRQMGRENISLRYQPSS
ncbi:MAG: hypothetical protein ABIP42_08855 [Planctomycetota bacterium]